MKKLLLVSLLLCNGFVFAQDLLTLKAIDSTSTEVPFNIIENVPVYKGCDPSLSTKELKDCMSEGIKNHVFKNFNTNIANGLDLSDGTVRINVIFKINVDGSIIDAQAQAPHPVLETEALRVVNLIPKLDKPGYFLDKPVVVPYSLPIIFKVENSKSSTTTTNSDAKFPIYRSCKETLDYEAQKQCTTEKIMDFIKVNTLLDEADKLFPTDRSTQFHTDFIIDKKGNIKDIQVKAHKREIAVLVIQALKKLPRFKAPGYSNGNPVDVPFSFLMTIYFD